MTKVLVTCPPMLGLVDEYRERFAGYGIELEAPHTVQTLSEEALVELVPSCDGWIIGDDPATRRVFEAGRKGKLRALVKWGVGVDNVDFEAARDLSLPVSNTPGMFGGEVADVALGYVIALARDTHLIDRGVRAGQWPKPRGISLDGARLALVGLGDIGRNIARRALACGMRVRGYDPGLPESQWPAEVSRTEWPRGIADADFLVLACALTPQTRHLVNGEVLGRAKRGLRVVNVSRGPLIDEEALVAALQDGQVYAAALDVFETEPLPEQSPLRSFERCIFGSHNGSNTEQAVRRASDRALALMVEFLGAGEG